jgi:putative Mn2+ efflux pump MntP
MEILTAFALAAGLSMDAVAVSILAGMSRPDERFMRALRMPLACGFFQALMPTIGWLGGVAMSGWVSTWDHWLVFALLVAIGGKMLWEAWRHDGAPSANDPFAWRTLLPLAIATSIDALAAGMSIALIGLHPGLTIGIIGMTTAVLCLPAVRLGARLGRRWAGRAEVMGGLVLILIGVKILIEHLRG